MTLEPLSHPFLTFGKSDRSTGDFQRPKRCRLVLIWVRIGSRLTPRPCKKCALRGSLVELPLPEKGFELGGSRRSIHTSLSSIHFDLDLWVQNLGMFHLYLEDKQPDKHLWFPLLRIYQKTIQHISFYRDPWVESAKQQTQGTGARVPQIQPDPFHHCRGVR